jgi:thiamine-phosphate pyrophosphorylase
VRRYYVTDRKQADVLACARRAIGDGVDMIQVREKDMEAQALLRLVRLIVDAAKGTETRVLVNDRLDVALAAGADGVHLPSDGLPAASVRSRIDLLGVSTHTIEEVQRAAADGTDFVVFGPVFETPGKTAVGLGRLREVTGKVRIPVYGIGGITMENAADVIASGATGIAGIRLFQA